MTTEHFTLQTARAAANAEISSRLQIFLTTLSSTIIALALVAQLSGLGTEFQAFALVLLPIVYFLGLANLVRIGQASYEWRLYGQGMNRIRHYFLEVAPDLEPYFVLPSTDDPRQSLAAVGIRKRWGPRWASGLVTAGAVVLIINSVVAGVIGWLVASITASGVLIPAFSAAACFLVSLLAIGASAERNFRRDLDAMEVVFPLDS